MDVMNKAAQLQNQVKQNNADLTDFLKDLTRWEEKVKNEDHNLKSERKLEEALPPVRSKVQKVKASAPAPAPAPNVAKKKVKDEKAARISSYDYDAWSKFDVDGACENVDKEDGDEEEEEEEDPEVEMGDESEDENNEELDKLRIQQALQKSIMEKEKGNQLFKEGKYDAAINRYTSAISLNPRNPILYANRGMALIKKEQYAAAEQDCDVALQLDPSYSKAIARRGTARKKMKRYEEALKDFTLLLKVEPKNQQATNEIKELNNLLKKGEHDHREESKGSVENSTSSTKPKKTKILNTNGVEERIRRSTKPLKRIKITEVGFDEPDERENEKMNAKNSSNSTHTTAELKSAQLTAPTSSFMFETEFKKLKHNTEEFYAYIKLIPVCDYIKLFYQSIDNIISPFLTILKECYVRDQLPYHEEMTALSQVSRFDMAIMFLSSKDKTTLKHLIAGMKSDSYGHQLQAGVLEGILKRYDVKL